MRDRLNDLDRDHIPTIEQAREFMLDLPRDRADKLTRELSDVQAQIRLEQEYASRDPVRDEIQWQDALDRAAIAKEKIERQFVEPSYVKASADRPKEREKEEERISPERKEPGSRKEEVRPVIAARESRTGFVHGASEATKDTSREITGEMREGIRRTTGIAESLLGGVGAGVHAVADALDSLLSVKLTPEQVHEAEEARHRREAEAETSIDYSRYTAELAQQRQQQENERAGDRQRDGAGRDR